MLSPTLNILPNLKRYRVSARVEGPILSTFPVPLKLYQWGMHCTLLTFPTYFLLGLQLAGLLVVQQFSHGQSNPTYYVQFGDRHLVLRKKPPGKLLPSAHAVEREYRWKLPATISKYWAIKLQLALNHFRIAWSFLSCTSGHLGVIK